MQHLGLLPVSTKASSKATKNGQHNHHSVDHSTRMLSKLGNSSDVLSSSVVSPADLPKEAGDPYMFHEADVKSTSSLAVDRGLPSATNSIPIARLYPELAEKLDLEAKRTDGHKLANFSQSQPVNHVSAPTVDKRLTDGVQHSLDVSRTASLPCTVRNRFPLSVSSNSRSSVDAQSRNTPNLTRLMLDPVVSTAVVSSPLIGYPWETSVSGQSVSSMVHTSPQLLSQALCELLNVTSSATQTVPLPCLKFQAPRSEISVPPVRPNQNVLSLHGVHESNPFETGKTAAKPCCQQTVGLPRSPAESAAFLKSQPCAACLVRPRPRPTWQHKVSSHLRRRTLHKSSWKLYADHVARLECNSDILPCGKIIIFSVN